MASHLLLLLEPFTFTFALLLTAGAEWRLDPFVRETELSF